MEQIVVLALASTIAHNTDLNPLLKNLKDLKVSYLILINVLF